MAYVKLFLAVLVVLAVFHSALATFQLTGCDDCYARARLIYGHHYMDATAYGAYAVSSNGHVLLLDNVDSDLNGYPFGPRPLSVVRGSPILAGFWADADLRCESNETDNRVLFEETIDVGFLWLMRSVIGVSGFFPNSAVVVHYENVQRFNCPATAETNTFSIVIVTDQSIHTTYILYIYDEMGWNRATLLSANNAVVGFSNGQGQGLAQRLGPDPASAVSHGLLIYRIDPRFRRAAEAMVDKGNVAQEQQKDGGGGENVILQNFEVKEVLKNGVSAMALQEVDRTLQQAETDGNVDVTVHHFQDRMKN